MKAQVTGSGGFDPSRIKAKVEPRKKQGNELSGQDSAADSFQSSTSATLTSLESRARNAVESKDALPQTPEAPKEKATPLVLTPEMRVDNAPLILTEEQRVEPSSSEGGPTFAEMARSATQSIGRGVRSLLGDELAVFESHLADINGLEKMAQELKTPEQFQAKTAEFKKRLAAGATLEDLRPEAYAVAREAAKQETQMRAYDCQVIGALAMDDGHIAEMKTGEGKTLTAVLPLYLNALAGKGAHLVTVNETLAKRDSEWMGPIFKKLGMTVGCVTDTQSTHEKREGYNCDVTYVSDRALGFDFLRDRRVLDPRERVQRGHFFALIDEVDEVLIDEARTPMIISSPSGEPSEDYKIFGDIIKTLVPGDDFKLDEEKRTVWPTDGGYNYIENELTLLEAKKSLATAAPGSEEAKEARQTIEAATLLRGAIRRENSAQKAFDDIDYDKPNALARKLGMHGEWDKEAAAKAEAKLKVATNLREELASKVDTINIFEVENTHRLSYLFASLKAHTLFRRGKDYTVENGEVKIVDSNKGRVSEGKRFSQGLHQALEVKEGLEPKRETRTMSKITMPELVAQYERKSGMTGTGKTSEEEFIHTYGLDVVEIPTNKPVIRVDHPDVVFATKEAKFQKVVSEAMKAAEAGRPVLVGTVSVNANRDVAARILEAGWPADRIQILNAETVKGGEDSRDPNAGRSGTITLTTGDRADQVKHDPINYKKIAFSAQEAAAEGKPVLLDMDKPEDAEQVQAWLAGAVPVSLVDKPNPKAGAGVQIRVRKKDRESEVPQGFSHLDAANFAVEKPLRFKVTDENLQDILPKALDAFAEGEPVILESGTRQQLGEAAQGLLDHGLGLEAIPMVCEGKEKENVMIEMAGRSGMITVATNMAGRGANIKPDLVATAHISEAAYEKATAGKPTTITVKKKSQAEKIERLLKEFVSVSSTEDPEHKAKPGEVLVRHGKDLPKLDGENDFHGDDFATNGLLVIGTERAQSRRVDNQLIGRSGRQGAVGDSIFYTSLEDDIARIFGGENFEPLLEMFGDSQEGVASNTVNRVMTKAQERVENQHYDQRFNSLKYQGVHRDQRRGWYQAREQVLTGEEDAVELVTDFATQGLSAMLLRKLGEGRRHEPGEVTKAVSELSKELKVPLRLDLNEPVKSKDFNELLYPQVEKLMNHPDLSSNKLRGVTLGQMDFVWQDHLEAMERLQDGIHLVTMGGGTQKPEDVFPHRAAEVYNDTVDHLKERLATQILPAVASFDQSAKAKTVEPAAIEPNDIDQFAIGPGQYFFGSLPGLGGLAPGLAGALVEDPKNDSAATIRYSSSNRQLEVELENPSEETVAEAQRLFGSAKKTS